MLLLLLACATPPPEPCARPGIRDARTGEVFDTLGEALTHVGTDGEVCVGPGAYSLADTRRCDSDSRFTDQHLALRGVGPGETLLLGPGGEGDAGCADLALSFGADSTVSLASLRIEQATVDLEAEEITLHDVEIADTPPRIARALSASAERLDVSGLRLHDARIAYTGGLYLRGEGELRDLVLEDLVLESGYVVELIGPLDWIGGGARGLRTEEPTEGYDVVETWGEVHARDLLFSDNEANGPLLTDHGQLTLEDAHFEDNRVSWRGVLSSDGQTRVQSTALLRNTGHPGAMSVWGEGMIYLENLTLRDSACAVASDQGCIQESLEEGQTLACDVNSCR